MKTILFLPLIFAAAFIVNNASAQKVKANDGGVVKPSKVKGDISVSLTALNDSIVQDKCKDFYIYKYKIVLHNSFDVDVRFILHITTVVVSKNTGQFTNTKEKDTIILLRADSSKIIRTSSVINYPYTLGKEKSSTVKQFIKSPININISAKADYAGTGIVILQETRQDNNTSHLNSVSPLPLPCFTIEGGTNTH